MSKIDKYTIDDLLKEADKAVSDKNWTISKSSCPELFNDNSTNIINWVAFLGGIRLAGAAAFGLPLLGPVGWGIAAIAAGKAIKNDKKKQEAKMMAYRYLIERQNAVIRALQNEARADKERIESLTRLNQLLTEAIRRLQEQ